MLKTTYTDPANIRIEYIETFIDLYVKCKKEGIQISGVKSFWNGIQIFFEGLDGDAVLHDGSNEHEYNLWETMGFPWDNGDVSIHTTDELIQLIKQHQPWPLEQ